MVIKSKYLYSDLLEQIIRIAISVYKTLGPGFVEKIYQRALYLEFKNYNLKFNRERKITVMYKKVNLGYEQVDFDTEGKILIEVKAVAAINGIYIVQLLSYLKLSDRKVGLISNFAREKLKIKRVVN